MTKGNSIIPGILPNGFRDYLQAEALAKRVAEDHLADVFSRWGFDEVSTPALEYEETVGAGACHELGAGVFRLFDRRNRLLVLRQDMTTPIARMVATRLREQPLPLRLSYRANAFRMEEHPQIGRSCEYTQVGVELIGPTGLAGDAEIGALAVTALRSVGIERFELAIGHTDFVKGLLEEIGCPVDQENAVKTAISRRDFVALEQLTTDWSPADRERILALPTLHGGIEVLARCRELAHGTRALQAADYLEQLYQRLTAYGVTDAITIEPALILDFEYYSGVVFEGYAAGIGFPVLSGGRYDGLLGRFGADLPATGFALWVDRLLLVLAKTNGGFKPQAAEVYVVGSSGKANQGILLATRLRSEGLKVELSLVEEDSDREVAFHRAQQKGIPKIWFAGEDYPIEITGKQVME